MTAWSRLSCSFLQLLPSSSPQNLQRTRPPCPPSRGGMNDQYTSSSTATVIITSDDCRSIISTVAAYAHYRPFDYQQQPSRDGGP